MGSWIDPMRQKILIAPHLPENIVLFRSLEARRTAMHGRPPAPAGGKRHVARGRGLKLEQKLWLAFAAITHAVSARLPATHTPG